MWRLLLVLLSFGAGLFSALASISISKVTRCVTMPRIVFTATWAVGTLFILQYMMPSIWGLGIFRAIAGFFMGFVTPIANTLISKAVPVECRGVVFGAVSSVAYDGQCVGSCY